MLKTISSSIYQEGMWGGGLGGQKSKHLDSLPNGWTDCHQSWYTPADSSGNGHRLNTISPSIPQGALGGGGYRGSKIQKSGNGGIKVSSKV